MRRLLLLAAVVIWESEGIARIFRENSHYRPHYISSSYSSKRYLRSPDTRFSRSRVFRNVVVNANDEPRLRSQGRFYKRAQAVPIHDPSQNPTKDLIQIAAYSYDEEKHHEKKLLEDSMTMVEAHEFARGLERTTVSVKTEDTTTVVPSSIPTQFTAALRAQPKPEVQQPPPTFIQPPQPAPVFKQFPGGKTFSQTVQAGGGFNGQIQAGRPPALINGPFSVQPQPVQPFPAGFLPAVPGTPALPVRIGLPPDPLVPPPFGVPPPTAIVPPTSSSNIPNYPPSNIQHPPPPQNQLPPPLPATGPNGAILLPNGQPPIPVRDTRFEVINQQAANSSLEQLGCGFDWITNTCKDIFNIGWCGRCHDFGSPPFIHDCKCTHPLVQLPPRPTPQPRPAFLRYL